jgi:hypothetical protein
MDAGKNPSQQILLLLAAAADLKTFPATNGMAPVG